MFYFLSSSPFSNTAAVRSRSLRMANGNINFLRKRLHFAPERRMAVGRITELTKIDQKKFYELTAQRNRNEKPKSVMSEEQTKATATKAVNKIRCWLAQTPLMGARAHSRESSVSMLAANPNQIIWFLWRVEHFYQHHRIASYRVSRPFAHCSTFAAHHSNEIPVAERSIVVAFNYILIIRLFRRFQVDARQSVTKYEPRTGVNEWMNEYSLNDKIERIEKKTHKYSPFAAWTRYPLD